MASGFSRLQLAAALLEYDNDPGNPDAPRRSAHESAIFAHLRRNAGASLPVMLRSDHPDVSLAEGASAGQRNSSVDNMKLRSSRGSIDALRNPFGADDQMEFEDEVEGEGLEVDLASWGLDAFMPKEKASKNAKGKQKSADLPAPHAVSSVPSHHPLTNNDTIATSPRRALSASRSMSVGGNLEYFGIEKAALEKQASLRTDNRRRSIGSPLDLVGMELPQVALQRRRASSHTAFQTPSFIAPHSVPFPLTPASSSLHPGPTAAPSFAEPSRLSAPDHQRTMSNATLNTVLLADDNPFSLRPPSRASRFDPKAVAHARTTSNASMGSRMLLDNDGTSMITGRAQQDRERRYSTNLDLLRPKVLVMPSPLQSAAPPSPALNEKVRDGFHISTDGPPLPPGARSARRSSTALSMIDIGPPIASNSFTPNPLTTLSLSQMTFRNTLTVGDSAYADGSLPRATQDGDQVQLDATGQERTQTPLPLDVDEFPKTGRPAGKLFGKSLIDDLENRKAQMRNKQRVFTGDQRPSMMARGPQRVSTLIDPAGLQTRPPSQRMSSYGSQGSQQVLGRRNSANAKPLLNFDEDTKLAPPPNLPIRLPTNRSVFGVDTLWEKEMVKLRQIELQEKLEAEERIKSEEGLKKRKKKRGGKVETHILEVPSSDLAGEVAIQPKISKEPPKLPDVRQADRKPPPVLSDDSESESEDEGLPITHNEQAIDTTWGAVSSDEEDNGPRRMTGTGPRYPSKRQHQRLHSKPNNDNSDDDVPLSMAVERAIMERVIQQKSSDDEEKPLSDFWKQQSRATNNGSDPGRKDDDDDQPLGLRTSRLTRPLRIDGPVIDGDDDDRPLAYHPEQQRRTQYQIMAQNQQQIMLQAQMQNSVFFSPPSMMGPPFFQPPMMPMMMQTSIPMPPPPPIHDEAKYGRVDRWRHDVAVEGDT